ncbi:hypothetical protein [Thiosocius teredinicola]|uniref:hypothetical protein n=1 Tax=Thiosocius teredinicola TaxID=1973002 RepID=UPI000990C9D5
MPFFEENPLEKLVFKPGDAEAELDLKGLATNEAMEKVEDLLAAEVSAASYLITFDGARDDGRETLFLPLGRRLLQARRDGRISRCLPASDGTGYFIAFGGEASDGN